MKDEMSRFATGYPISIRLNFAQEIFLVKSNSIRTFLPQIKNIGFSQKKRVTDAVLRWLAWSK